MIYTYKLNVTSATKVPLNRVEVLLDSTPVREQVFQTTKCIRLDPACEDHLT